MRILLLADVASGHTEKWALGLAQRGIEVGIFSLNKTEFPWMANVPNIKVLFELKERHVANGLSSKFTYFTYIPKLKKIISNFKPDVVHAHYASSYGLLGALIKFHPFVLSAWGTDVMKFPQENFMNKKIMRFNLKCADAVCATSETINAYIQELYPRKVNVIPFGIDFNTFKPDLSLRSKDHFVIGAIKSLEKIYNIDVLIKAFVLVHSKYPKTQLMIVGDGKEKDNLKRLVKQLNLNDSVEFTGKVPFKETVNYFNKLNCLVNVSQYESFGVSVIEAMACMVPVVVSDTGGLKDIVSNGETGTCVEPGNIAKTVEAIERVIMDKNFATTSAEKALNSVRERFNWQTNLDQQIAVYQLLVKT
ncbi:MAG: glycosyltransferase [Bacteroidota bacterium]|nr:glycosyltransferase [Bacteroidota bacterium]